MPEESNLDSLSLDDLEYTMLVDYSTNILVVDDEDVILQVFEALLADTAYQVGYASSSEQAQAMLAKEEYNLLIVDKNLPGESGLELIRKARAIRPESEFIVITGYASYDSAVEALRLGAYDYLEKPFGDLMLVKEKIDRALEKQRLLHENIVLADQLRSVHKELRSKENDPAMPLEPGGGADPALRNQIEELRKQVNQAARNLKQAFGRLKALSDNRQLPELPGREIQALLKKTWAHLSAARAAKKEVRSC